MIPNPIKIGTRSSPLAMTQAVETRDRLMEIHSLEDKDFEIVPIKTSGDRILNRSLSEVGGKGLFTKEIEVALLNGTVDIGVHSSKDMPTILPDGLGIVCYLPREDVRDAFISSKASTLMDLPQKSVVGTASLRRKSMVKRLRPDLKVVLLRGNVQTRLSRIEEGHADATILALAGLKRLGLENVVSAVFETDSFLPAVGQGAVCIEAKMDNAGLIEFLDAINDNKTADCLAAERAFLDELDGSCKTPIAGLARVISEKLIFKGEMFSPDGDQFFETVKFGSRKDPDALGREAGAELLSAAGPEFLKQWVV